MKGEYQTFVQLDPYEKWILQVLRAGMKKTTGRNIPISRLIGTVIREYWEEFQRGSDPQLLEDLVRKIPPPAPPTFMSQRSVGGK